MITTGYFWMNNIRYKEHNMYHRSRMFEYELLSNLYKIFPIGTPLKETLSNLGLDESATIKWPPKNEVIVDILPELPIPKNEQRDYTGYYLQFENNRLVSIVPVGPDIARNVIELSKLEIGKRIHFTQRP